MSFVDLNQLSPLALVSQYILEARGSGHFVTREESSILSHWIELSAGSADDLILLLEDIFAKRTNAANQGAGISKISLRSLNRIVVKRLMNKALLKGGIANE